MRTLRTRAGSAFWLPVLLLATAGCDLAGSGFSSQETAEWRKSYELQPGGSVEIRNVNGQIAVEPSSGQTVEVVAIKRARGGTPEAAREALQHIEIAEEASAGAIRIETKFPRTGGFLQRGGEVQYSVRVPPSARATFRTVNGGIEVVGLTGPLQAATTNGGIRARQIGGPIEASTTNGGVDVELTRVADEGARLKCTNGGITVRLPADARANLSASVTNGGIDAEGLSIETTESSRRRLEARLNGGGPTIRMEGTNGGIRIRGR
jgi:hypothetical protein